MSVFTQHLKSLIIGLLITCFGVGAMAQHTPKISWKRQWGPAYGTVAKGGPVPAGLDTMILPTGTQRLGTVELADIDNDGDLDILSGSNVGRLFFYRNTGNKTVPHWKLDTGSIYTLDTIKIGKAQNTNEVRPTLVDIDADGDLDLFVGSRWDYGGVIKLNDTHFFRNIGTKSNPIFTYDTIPGLGVNDPPVGSPQQVGEFSFLSPVDIDGDGDFDLVTGGSDTCTYFLNIGTIYAPHFLRVYRSQPNAPGSPWNPFFGWNYTSFLIPTPRFRDFDRDGDMDMFFMDEAGIIKYMPNLGSDTQAVFSPFTAYSLPTLDTVDFGSFGALEFGDVDGDGVDDLIATDWKPTKWFWYKGIPDYQVVLNAHNISCNGLSDGSIKAKVFGGKGHITYAWSTSATTDSISGLASGTYSVTITDSLGRKDSATVTLTQPDTLKATLTATNVTCFGLGNGQIAANISGGTAPYTYAWSNGATTQNLSTLAPGSYTVTVTDKNNCTATSTASITQPAPLAASITQGARACYMAGDSVLLSTPANSNFTFSWAKSTYNNFYAINNPQFAASSLTSHTLIENPQLKLDNNDVKYVAYRNKTETKIYVKKQVGGLWQIVGDSAVSPSNSDKHQFAIDKNNNLYIAYLNQNKIYVHKYNGTTWSALTSAVLTGLSTTEFKLDLSPNNQPYIVLRDNNAADKATVIKYANNSWSLVGSAGFTPYAVTKLCLKIDNANVPYIAYQEDRTSGQTQVYYFRYNRWNRRNYSYNFRDWAAPHDMAITSKNTLYLALESRQAPNKPVVFQLVNGNWTKLGDDVSALASNEMDIEVNANDEAVIVFKENGKASVKKLNDKTWERIGLAEFSAGNAFGLSLALNKNQVPVVAYTQDAGNPSSVMMYGPIYNTFSNLNSAYTSNPSIHILTVTDTAGGCVSKDSILVYQCFVAKLDTVINASCNGQANGTATVSVTGGTKPYTYTWSNGDSVAIAERLAAGNYSVTVKDAINNADTFNFTITQPSLVITANINQTSPLCFNPGDSIQLTAASQPGKRNNWLKQQLNIKQLGKQGYITTNFGEPYTAVNSKNEVYTYSLTIDQKPIVTKFNGQKWDTVGQVGFSNGNVLNYQMVFDSQDNPYVMFREYSSNELIVKKFDGTSWVTVGGSIGLRPQGGFLRIHNDTLYVLYADYSGGTGGKATLKKYDGTSWVSVGVAGFSASVAQSIVLQFEGNTPVALIRNNTDFEIYKYTGGAWVQQANVNTHGITPYTTRHPHFVIAKNNTYYLAFKEANYPHKTHVFQYKNGSWSKAGVTNFPSIPLVSLSLITDNNSHVYLAFPNQTNRSKISVLKFDGYDWKPLYKEPLNNFEGYRVNLALDKNDQLYLTYVDADLAYGVTTMQVPNLGAYQQTSNGFYAKQPGNYILSVQDTASGCAVTDTIVVAQCLDVTYTTVDEGCNNEGSGYITLHTTGGVEPYSYKWPNHHKKSYRTQLGDGMYSVTVTDAVNTTKVLNFTLTPASSVSAQIGGITSNACFNRNDSVLLTANTDTSYTYSWLEGENPPATRKTVSGIPAGSTSASWSLEKDTSGTPHLLLLDGGKPSVYKKTATGWVALGNTKFTTGNVVKPGLVFDNNNVPHVYFVDYSTGSKVTVMKLSGATWTLVGTAGLGVRTAEVAMAFDQNNTPYVHLTGTINSYRSFVYSFDGSAWNPVGPSQFTPTKTEYPSIYFDASDSLYTAGLEGKDLVIRKFNGSSWRIISSYNHLNHRLTASRAAINNSGEVFFAIADKDHGNLLSVVKYDGSNFSLVGKSGFRSQVYHAKIDFDKNQTPYLGFISPGTTGQPSAYTFKNNRWTKIYTSSIIGRNTYSYTFVVDSSGQPYSILKVRRGYANSYEAQEIDAKNIYASPVAGTDSTFYVKTPGYYQLLVTDTASGCAASQQVQVAQCFESEIVSSTNVSCYGDTNGSIIVKAYGGNPPYTYAWSNGSTKDTLNNLAAGTYTVTISGTRYGQTDTHSVTITSPAQITANINQGTTACFNAGDSVAISAPANSNYSFNWSKVGQAGLQQVGDSNFSPTGAIYKSLLNYDNNGVAYSVFEDPQNAKNAIIKKLVGNTWTNVGGSITNINIVLKILFDASNTPHIYYVKNAPTEVNLVKLVGNAWVNVPLSSGVGSISDVSADASGVIYEASEANNKTTLKKLVNGSWVVVGTSPFSPNQFTLSIIGFNAQNQPILFGVNASNKIEANTYNGTSWVKDNSFDSLSINASDWDNYYIEIYRNGSNLFVFYTGGTALSAVQYNGTKWSHLGPKHFVTATTPDNLFANVNGSNVPHVFYTESTAPYKAYLKKFDGSNWVTTYSSDSTAAALGFAFNQNDEPVMVVQDYTKPVLSLNAMKIGTGNVPVSTSPSAHASDSGLYILTVTDTATGCSISDSIIVSECFTAKVDTFTHASCYGVKDGTASVSASGGVQPYKYTWSNGDSTANVTLAGGTYTVTVSDAVNSADTFTVTINQPAQVIASINQGTTACFNAGDSVQLSTNVLGGYSYSWYKPGSGGFVAVDSTTLVSYSSSDVFLQLDNNDVPYLMLAGTPSTLLKHNGSSWVTASNSGLDLGSGKPNVTFDNNNNLFVVQDSSGLRVKQLVGTSWVSTSNAALSSTPTTHGKLVVDNQNNLYLVYFESGNLSIKKYDGSTWQSYGSSLATTLASFDVAMSSTNEIYVTVASYSNRKQLNLHKFNGTSWSLLATHNNATDIHNVVMDLNKSNTAHVMYETITRFNVLKESNGTLSTLGNIQDSLPSSTFQADLIIDNNNKVYVAFTDFGAANGNTVKMLDGTKWVSIGDARSTNPNYWGYSLAVDRRNSLYVGYWNYNGTTPGVHKQSKNLDLITSGSSVYTSDSNLYTLTVTDTATGCSVSDSIIVSECFSAKIDTNTAASCFGESDGTATASGSGGVKPYSFKWANGDSTASTSGLAAGSHSVTVSDAVNNSDTLTVTITQPAQVIANILQGDSTCFAPGDSVMLSAQSGPNYKFSWAKPGAPKFVNLGANGYSTNRGFDSYISFDNNDVPHVAFYNSSYQRIEVKKYDGNNWTMVGATSSDLTVSSDAYPQLQFDGSNVPYVAFRKNKKVEVYKLVGQTWTAVANNDLSSIQLPNGGVGFQFKLSNTGEPYVFIKQSSNQASIKKYNGTSWANVSTTGLSVINSNIIQLGFDNTNAPHVAYYNGTNNSASLYVYKLVGASWVTVGGSAFSQSREDAYGLGFNSSNQVHILYNKKSDGGKLYVSRYTGSAWSDLGSNISANNTFGRSVFAMNNSGDPFVFYQEYATNKKGYVKKYDGNSWVLVDTNAISENDWAYMALAVNSQGTPAIAYRYNLSSNSKARIQTMGRVNEEFSAINSAYTSDSALHILTVTDTITGCSATDTVFVEPCKYPIAKITVDSNVSCYGLSDASITASVKGGIKPHSFLWSTGDTAKTLSGLAIGSFSVTVTDNLGDTSSATVTVTQPDSLILTATVDSNLTCYGSNNGVTSVNIAGGTKNFALVWNNGSHTVSDTNAMGKYAYTMTSLMAGAQQVVVTDAKGCKDSAAFTITQPDSLQLTIRIDSNERCTNANNGGLTALVLGGTRGYSYAWSGSRNNDSLLTGLTTGNYTLTVTDTMGCTITKTKNLPLLDDIKPVAKAKNDTIYLDGFGNASITAADVNNNSTDNCQIDSLTLSKSNFNCANTGANTIDLVVTDWAGNKDTAQATITVLDTIKPAMQSDYLTLYLDTNGKVSTTANAVNDNTTDACGITRMWLNDSTFDCGDVGKDTIYLFATDASGNTDSIKAVMTIRDTVKPVVRTKNINLYLAANGMATIGVADINNGTYDSCGIASLSLSDTSFSCADTGANTIYLTAVDVNGNSNSAMATVTVIDTVKPNVMVNNLTVYLDGFGAASITTSDIDNGTYDSCGVSLALSKSTFACSDTGANNVYLIATDVNGNVDSALSIVTVRDTIAPAVLTNNVTVYLDANGRGVTSVAAVDDMSTDACGFAKMELTDSTFNCGDIGANTIYLKIEDVNGNIDSTRATVTVRDTVKPVVVTQNINLYLAANGTATIGVPDINNGSYDSCGIASLSLSDTSFSCANTGRNTVYLKAVDVNGNVDSTMATVTVIDTVKPNVMAQNLTIYLNGFGSASITTSDIDNGTYDSCGVSLALSKSAFACSDTGANNVYLIATDVNGNVDSALSIVTVRDTVAPAAQSNNITVYLDANGMASTTAANVNDNTTDACGVATMWLSDSTFNCADMGANTIYLFARDYSGNVDSTRATITVRDTIKPVITVNSPITVCATDARGTLVTYSNSATDNCAPKAIVQTAGLASGSIFPQGTTVNVFEVEDSSGNMVTDSFKVVVHPFQPLTINKVKESCETDSAITLVGAPAGGSFSGTGVSNGMFVPSVVSNATVAVVYTFTTPENCTYSDSIYATVRPLPSVSLGSFEDTLCYEDEFIACPVATPSGGTYTGTGIVNDVFETQTAGIGKHVITYTYTSMYGCVNSDSTVANVQYCFDPAGEEELDNPVAQFRIFPNPNRGNFIIEFSSNASSFQEGEVVAEIISPLGQIVQRVELNQARTEVDLNNPESGMYMLRITGAENQINQLHRIVIQ